MKILYRILEVKIKPYGTVEKRNEAKQKTEGKEKVQYKKIGKKFIETKTIRLRSESIKYYYIEKK